MVGLRYWILTKRMLKKLSFLLLLCTIPLMVFGMRQMSGQESGIVALALCVEDQQDKAALEVVEKLTSVNSVARFLIVDTEEEGRKAVLENRVDAVWVFKSSLEDRLLEYGSGKKTHKAVKIIEREDSVGLQLAREKLYGILYSDIAYGIYIDFVKEELLDNDEQALLAAKEELDMDYQENHMDKSIFEFSFLQDQSDGETRQAESYLMVPLRGILALMVILCGLAANLYFLQDESKGIMAGYNMRKRRHLLYLYQVIAMVPAAIAVLIAYKASGIAVSMVREIACMFLYIAGAAIFGSFVTAACRKLEVLAALIPVLMITLMVLCPVFFAVRHLHGIQMIFPPYLYLFGTFNDTFILRQLIYISIGGLLELGYEKFFLK